MMGTGFTRLQIPFANNYQIILSRPEAERRESHTCIYEFLLNRFGAERALRASERRVGSREVVGGRET